jgi:nicotinate-nucleotide pyrophosphorylase (carboxylating)
MTLPSYLDESILVSGIKTALAEDVGPGDVTSLATISPDRMASAVLKAKEAGVVAGLFVAKKTFRMVGPTLEVEWMMQDGDRVMPGEVIGTISGNAREILQAERVALNYVQRMSGIATMTQQMVHLLAGTTTKLLDTRKTAPGLRMLDKWAVLLGGGSNHRVGLFDMILIKENHIASAGGIENALDRAVEAKKNASAPLNIEIEVTSTEELNQVLAHGGADRVMLDNFVRLAKDGSVDTSRLNAALNLIDGRLETEASGNVTEATLGAIGQTGVNFVSSGALTHSVRALDVSLVISIHD